MGLGSGKMTRQLLRRLAGLALTSVPRSHTGWVAYTCTLAHNTLNTKCKVKIPQVSIFTL